MTGGLEHSSINNRNLIQIMMAKELFGDSVKNDDDMMMHWVKDGYAERLADYFAKNPGMEEKILDGQDKIALENLKKEIFYH